MKASKHIDFRRRWAFPEMVLRAQSRAMATRFKTAPTDEAKKFFEKAANECREALSMIEEARK